MREMTAEEEEFEEELKWRDKERDRQTQPETEIWPDRKHGLF